MKHLGYPVNNPSRYFLAKFAFLNNRCIYFNVLKEFTDLSEMLKYISTYQYSDFDGQISNRLLDDICVSPDDCRCWYEAGFDSGKIHRSYMFLIQNRRNGEYKNIDPRNYLNEILKYATEISGIYQYPRQKPRYLFRVDPVPGIRKRPNSRAFRRPHIYQALKAETSSEVEYRPRRKFARRLTVADDFPGERRNRNGCWKDNCKCRKQYLKNQKGGAFWI